MKLQLHITPLKCNQCSQLYKILIRKIGLFLQLSRMSVDFLYQALDADFARVELEFLAVLCSASLVSLLMWRIRRPRIYILNLTAIELGSVEARGSSVVLIVVPVVLAFGGSSVRKRRAGLAQAENGLNRAVISVMNLVIILAVGLGLCRTPAMVLSSGSDQKFVCLASGFPGQSSRGQTISKFGAPTPRLLHTMRYKGTAAPPRLRGNLGISSLEDSLSFTTYCSLRLSTLNAIICAKIRFPGTNLIFCYITLLL